MAPARLTSRPAMARSRIPRTDGRMALRIPKKDLQCFARFLPVCLLLLACTTPSSQARVRLQRVGSLPDWQRTAWAPVQQPMLGEPFLAAEGLDEELRLWLEDRLRRPATDTLETKRLDLGRARLGCGPHANGYRCHAQLIVELHGKVGKRALWAGEGLAWVDLESKVSPRRLKPVATRLLEAALLALERGPQRRPAAAGRGPLAQALRRGDPKALKRWVAELSSPAANEDRRIALWLAIGHLARPEDKKRLEEISALSQREREARQLALDWLAEITP